MMSTKQYSTTHNIEPAFVQQCVGNDKFRTPTHQQIFKYFGDKLKPYDVIAIDNNPMYIYDGECLINLVWDVYRERDIVPVTIGYITKVPYDHWVDDLEFIYRLNLTPYLSQIEDSLEDYGAEDGISGNFVLNGITYTVIFATDKIETIMPRLKKRAIIDIDRYDTLMSTDDIVLLIELEDDV